MDSLRISSTAHRASSRQDLAVSAVETRGDPLSYLACAILVQVELAGIRAQAHRAELAVRSSPMEAGRQGAGYASDLARFPVRLPGAGGCEN